MEACIGVLGIQDICHFTSRDIGYYPFYFQGYGILCSIFFVTSRDIDYSGNLIMGIFIRDTCLFTSRDIGYLVPPPLYKPHHDILKSLIWLQLSMLE